jgi:CSLREA domain-containing protein
MTAHTKWLVSLACCILIVILVPDVSLAQVKTFTVNKTGDEGDPNAGNLGDDGQCDVDPLTPGNQCTLRAAIQNHNGNRHLGTNEIKFNIPNAPGTGSIIIRVGSSGNSGALPVVFGSVIIKAKNDPDGRRIELTEASRRWRSWIAAVGWPLRDLLFHYQQFFLARYFYFRDPATRKWRSYHPE